MINSASGASTREIWLPAKFWNDHADRELPAGELVREAGSRVLVKVTCDELSEIRSDASYYADPAGPDDYEGRAAMVRSAKATVRAIDAACSGGACKKNGGHVWLPGSRHCRDCGKPIEEAYGYAEMTAHKRESSADGSR